MHSETRFVVYLSRRAAKLRINSDSACGKMAGREQGGKMPYPDAFKTKNEPFRCGNDFWFLWIVLGRLMCIKCRRRRTGKARHIAHTLAGVVVVTRATQCVNATRARGGTAHMRRMIREIGSEAQKNEGWQGGDSGGGVRRWSFRCVLNRKKLRKMRGKRGGV